MEGAENVANKVTYLESGGENTHTQYPSAKAVEQFVNVELSNYINKFNDINFVLDSESINIPLPPSSKAVADYVGDKIPLIINIWEDGGNIVSELSGIDSIMYEALNYKRPIIVYEWNNSDMMYILYAYTMTSGELGLYKFSTVKDGNLIELNGSGNGSGNIVWAKTIQSMEDTENKITYINETSTDTQYPTAKAVFDYANTLNDGVYDTLLLYQPTQQKVTTLSSTSTDAQYPSAKAVVDYVDNSVLLVESELQSYQPEIYKVTTLSADSTDIEYPSAKAVVDYVGNIETALDSIIAIQNELIGGDTV